MPENILFALKESQFTVVFRCFIKTLSKIYQILFLLCQNTGKNWCRLSRCLHSVRETAIHLSREKKAMIQVNYLDFVNIARGIRETELIGVQRLRRENLWCHNMVSLWLVMWGFLWIWSRWMTKRQNGSWNLYMLFVLR